MLHKSSYDMKKAILSSALAFLLVILVNAGLKPGDNAYDFSLKNVDGKRVSLSDYSDQKGVIVVFTCNPCPYANAYEQRIIALHKKYTDKGFPVVAIDPNDDEISPEDTFAKMKDKAATKGYPFPYLKDETQEVYKIYGATNTPHIYLLKNEGGTFKVAYVGAIDNNAMDEESVTTKYVENAIAALLSGKNPSPSSTKAIGCGIKSKS
jgi:peroxiredoxin